MLKLAVISILTMLGVGLTNQVREVHTESSPVILKTVSIPSEVFAITSEAKAMAKAPNLKPAPKAIKPSGGSVEQMVREAARKYGLGEEHFLSIARCESGLNASNVNYNYYAGGGHPSGVFQFIPDTWTRMSNQAGFGGASVFDAYSNVNVAAWAWANGRSGEWECQG